MVACSEFRKIGIESLRSRALGAHYRAALIIKSRGAGKEQLMGVLSARR
jgi:hypothetical protein